MKEIKIFDRDENGNIIDLKQLIISIRKQINNFFEDEWLITEATCGYGEKACEMEDQVSKEEPLKVEGKTFFAWLENTDEYFFHLVMKKTTTNEEIGLFDSTYLFLKSENQRLLQLLNEEFLLHKE